MNLGLFNHNNSNNNLFSDFINELKKALAKEKSNTIAREEMLTSEEQSIYDDQRNLLLQRHRIETLNKGDMFVVNTEPPQMYLDRYKIKQILENGILSYKTLYDYELPDGIHKGDVLRKQGDEYIYDEESTKYLSEQLEEIQNNIIAERNKLSSK